MDEQVERGALGGGTPLDAAGGAAEHVSRRGLLMGLGAAAAGAGVVLGGAPTSLAAVPRLPVAAVPRPEALGPRRNQLTYLSFDGWNLVSQQQGQQLLFDGLSGFQPINKPGFLYAPLNLPIESRVSQLNVAYQGQPIIKLVRRPFETPNTRPETILPNLAAGGGPKTQTLDFGPIRLEPGASYFLEIFFSAGDSIYSMDIGYEPPTQSFVPFTGTPRVLDTREAGGKLQPGEERPVALGFPGARGAVVNLAITETEVNVGTGGFVAVFKGDIPWPGNASINWAGANQNLSNTVIVALDPLGQLRIRGGASRTHVVIDRIGWLI